MPAETKSFLPYHEPGIVTILIQSSFILILNIVNTLFDKLIFCGLLGQVFIGVAWGTPGAKWLGQDVEDVIVQLGYLGLILLVYQGENPSPSYTRKSCPAPINTLQRRPGHEFPLAEGKSLPLCRSSDNWDQLPHRSVLRAAIPRQCNAYSSFRSWSSSLLHQPGNYVYYP